jgi:hypothetical protein
MFTARTLVTIALTRLFAAAKSPEWWLICALGLAIVLTSGCATLQQPEVVAGCVAADVTSTFIGISKGAMKEANPLWKTTVNAGHFGPFVLAAGLLIWAVIELNEPAVSATVSATSCGLAAHNLWIIR